VGAVHGAAYADGLLDVNDVTGTAHVSGLVERPAAVGGAPRRVFLAVNGRAVRDAGLVRAAEAAYRSTIPAGLRPSLFLSVVVPAEQVDVNVHPAKAEVRFHDRWAVERAVERAVRHALGTLESGAALGARAWPGAGRTALGSAPGALTHAAFEPAPGAPDVLWLRTPDLPAGGLFADEPLGNATGTATLQPGAADTSDPRTYSSLPAGAPALAWDDDEPSAPPPPLARPAPGVWAAASASAAEVAVPPLTQLRRTYLMFERAEGLVLIDQHSAHERVLYERFLGALERGEAPSQRLLFPLTLHLTAAQAEAFEAHRDALARLGYEAEGFGGASVLVHAVPAPHPRFDAERCLRETLDALTGDRMASAHARHERLAATVACKAAVKAGDALSADEMRALYLALARTTLPAHDVHGRATVVHVGWDEVERRFGRR
jgi:DNA mismatch repair protein MutL